MEAWTEKHGPSPYVKLILGRLFSAVLNYTDFMTDILVMLEYGCFLQNALSTNCNIGLGNSWTPSCEPHWWWFGLSLSILVFSTIAQAFVYSLTPSGPKCCSFCCLGLFQLSYLRDLILAIRDPQTAKKEDEVKSSAGRDLTVKMLESSPQLYLQTHVLFTIQAHGDRLKVISTLISAASLSVGFVSFMISDPGYHQGLLRSFPRKLAMTLFFTTDQLLRASAYTLMMSEAARPVGMPVILLFAMAAWVLCYKAFGRSGFLGLFVSFGVGVLVGHIIPLYSLTTRLTGDSKDLRGSDRWQQLYLSSALPLRYVEMVLCGVVGVTMAKTACGQMPLTELVVFFALMSGNVIFCLVILFCMTSETQVDPAEDVKADADVPPMTLVGAKSTPGNE